MEKIQSRPDLDNDSGRPAAHNRSCAKDIAALALFLELTETAPAATCVEAATAQIAGDREAPATTLKRCASEARALIEFAHESGAGRSIRTGANESDEALRNLISDWLDETNLTTVLKRRALRLNRSRGGRPPTRARTLRAVEELLAFARAGQPGALDELRSIRALIDEA